MAGINLTTNFVPNTNNPLDSRIVCADVTARNSLAFTYEGMVAYVHSTRALYFLSGGSTSAYWHPLSAVAGHGGGGGSSTWGSISGNINLQTDLQNQFSSTLSSAHSYDKLLSGGLYTLYHSDDKTISGSLHSQVVSTSASNLNSWHQADTNVSASLYSTLHGQITSISGADASAYHSADKLLSGQIYSLYHSDDKTISGALHSQITATSAVNVVLWHAGDVAVSGAMHSQIVSVSASNLSTWHQSDISVSGSLYSTLHSQITSISASDSSAYHSADKLLSGSLYTLYHADDKSVSASLYSTLHGQITSVSAADVTAYHSADKILSGSLYTLYHADDKTISGALHSQITATSASNVVSWHAGDIAISGAMHSQVTATSASNLSTWHSADKNISGALHSQITATSASNLSTWHNSDVSLSGSLYSTLHGQITSISGADTSAYHSADKLLSGGLYTLYHSDDKTASGALHSQITATSAANFVSWHAGDVAVSGSIHTQITAASGGMQTLWHSADKTLSGGVYSLYHADDKSISGALHSQITATSAANFVTWHAGDVAVSGAVQTLLNGKETIFNGIVDYTKIVPSYNQATQTLTATYSTGASVCVNGVTYAKTGTDTVTHAATSGLWYVYYNSSGTLTISQTYWDLQQTAPLVYIRYNATTTSGIQFFEEHPAGTGMDNAVHKNLHFTRGTQYISGLGVTGYSLNTNGTTALQYAVASGIIADEDLFLTIAAISAGGPYSIWYRSGTDANGEWTTSDSNTVPLIQNGTDMLWNRLNAGSWSNIALTGNGSQYMNMWLAAVPRLDASGNSYLQSFLICGQAIYSSLASAQAATPASEISFGSFPFPEIVVFQQNTFERRNSFSPYNVNLIASVAVRFSAVEVITSASTIAATNITVDTASFTNNLSSADSTVQHALNTIDQLSTGGASSALSVPIAATAHGFTSGTVNKPIAKLANGTYILAEANSAANCEVVGVFTSYVDGNNFTVTQSGQYTWSGGVHGFTGPIVWLSDTSAGTIQEAAPTTVGNYLKAIARVIDTTHLEIIDYAAQVISSGTFTGTYGPATFNAAALSAGILTVNHNLGVQVVPAVIMDNLGKQVVPDEVYFDSTTSLRVDFSKMQGGGISGTWTVYIGAVAGGTAAFSTDATLSSLSNIAAPTVYAVATYANNLVKNNLFRNPAMLIAQRGTSFTNITTSTYTIDGMIDVIGVGGAGVTSVAQVSDAPTSAQAGVNSVYSLKWACTTSQASIGATDFVAVGQKIEGYRVFPAVGQTLMLSFWVKAYQAGKYYVSLGNSGTDRSFISPYTVASSNVWQKVVISVPMSYSGGTWNYTNGLGLVVYFMLALGSTYQTASYNTWLSGAYYAGADMVNSLSSTNNTFQITNLKLEVGTQATQFYPRDYEQELALNQRYFEKSYDDSVVPGTITSNGSTNLYVYVSNAATTQGGMQTFFKVSKRVTPTVITVYSPNNGAANYMFNAQGPTNVAVVTNDYRAGQSGFFAYTTSTNLGANLSYQWTASADL